ncbi:MAG: hypothetical protein JWQ25_731 [Daejeonella sp.]|nr:hypothetical protein [Daejeonella sp.]
MKAISNLFTIASGAFGVVPGVTVLISSIGVPPNTSKTLFAATIEALGVFTLLIIWANREKIEQYSIKKATKWAIIAMALFVITLFTYLFLYNYLVISVENSEPLLFPLWPQGLLKTAIEQMGTRENLINQWGRDDVYKVIQSSSTISILLTTLSLLLIYQAIFISLTFAFGILSIITKKTGLEADA